MVDSNDLGNNYDLTKSINATTIVKLEREFEYWHGVAENNSREIEKLHAWMEKASHHNYCMRLDIYDERDHGCTCGKEDLLK